MLRQAILTVYLLLGLFTFNAFADGKNIFNFSELKRILENSICKPNTLAVKFYGERQNIICKSNGKLGTVYDNEDRDSEYEIQIIKGSFTGPNKIEYILSIFTSAVPHVGGYGYTILINDKLQLIGLLRRDDTTNIIGTVKFNNKDIPVVRYIHSAQNEYTESICAIKIEFDSKLKYYTDPNMYDCILYQNILFKLNEDESDTNYSRYYAYVKNISPSYEPNTFDMSIIFKDMKLQKYYDYHFTFKFDNGKFKIVSDNAKDYKKIIKLLEEDEKRLLQ